MKTKPKAPTVLPGGSQKGKALRTARRKAKYGAQPMRTAANKKRRLRTHLRAHPLDARAIKAFEYELNYGSAAALGLSCKGRKHERR